MKEIRTRRAFLGAAGGLLSAFAIGWVVPACSSGAGSTPIRSKSKATKPPTDDDEVSPGDPTVQQGDVQPSNPGNPQWESRAKELEGANQGGTAYTATAPGPFAGKERSHVPNLTVQSDGVAVIVVNHVMDPGGVNEAGADGGDAGSRPEHFITTIYAKDDQDRVIYLKELTSKDASPPFIAFRIPDGTKSVRAFEHCNLHGVWASDDATVG